MGAGDSQKPVRARRHRFSLRLRQHHRGGGVRTGRREASPLGVAHYPGGLICANGLLLLAPSRVGQKDNENEPVECQVGEVWRSGGFGGGYARAEEGDHAGKFKDRGLPSE